MQNALAVIAALRLSGVWSRVCRKLEEGGAQGMRSGMAAGAAAGDPAGGSAGDCAGDFAGYFAGYSGRLFPTVASVDDRPAPIPDWVALAAVAAGGTRRWLDAARTLGSPRALLEADNGDLKALGFRKPARERLRDAPALRDAEVVVRRFMDGGGHVLTLDSPAYPELLREIRDPPLVLYVRGRVRADMACVALVGARRATRYGLRAAGELAAALSARGLCVVSGLARGIDTAAHQGALEQGRTLAVLAGGHDRPYPKGSGRLMDKISVAGAVLSEHPPGVEPRPFHFPVRNRIVTGLSLATVVVEAQIRSGSLVSARLALEEGREVLAIPGPIDSPVSLGCNSLIRDGARPCLSPEDVMEAIGWGEGSVQTALSPPQVAEIDEVSDSAGGPSGGAAARLSCPDSSRILELLRGDSLHPDLIIARTGFDGARVLSFLTTLELAGLVEETPSGRFRACREAFAADAAALPPRSNSRRSNQGT